jgi:predicted GNAT family acetyltransferase
MDRPNQQRDRTHVENTPLPVSLDSREDKRKEGTAAMRQQAIQYLAFDVHQATSVATVRAENGSIRMHATVATEDEFRERDH